MKSRRLQTVLFLCALSFLHRPICMVLVAWTMVGGYGHVLLFNGYIFIRLMTEIYWDHLHIFRTESNFAFWWQFGHHKFFQLCPLAINQVLILQAFEYGAMACDGLDHRIGKLILLDDCPHHVLSVWYFTLCLKLADGNLLWAMPILAADRSSYQILTYDFVASTKDLQ